ncbi:MAG TPA: hypothetical protein VHR86_04960 [Armatimonadota bacterium]|nr:hypothetical protein [Armatimonadota bacterium]
MLDLESRTDVNYCQSSWLRVPDDGGVLLRPFAGKMAHVESICESDSGHIVTLNIAGARLRCPLAYLDLAQRRAGGKGMPGE